MNVQTAAPYIHLVGSAPFDDAGAAFRTLCDRLGPHLRRVPDGETGRRSNWIRFIQEILAGHPDMEVDRDIPPLRWVQWNGVLLREIPRLKFRDGVDPASVRFEVGYAEDAIESFAVFDRLQSDGVIPAGIRFQVSLATPLAPGYNYVSPRAQKDFLAAFEHALLAEVAGIARALPHDRVALQWDVCQEVLLFEGYFPERAPDYKDTVFGELARIGAAVPEEIELGYHLCYGSPRDEHIVQPKDMGVMVEMVEGIVALGQRRIDYIHLPAPRHRTDDAFFAPLDRLALPRETDLIIGLIAPDDPEGNRARLAHARAHAAVAGIGTECGWGRKDPGRLGEVFDAHLALMPEPA